jgi:hypothetical protein
MLLTVFGVSVLTFMMVMYALERRGYGFLFGAWTVIAVRRFWSVTHGKASTV